jgi:cobalt-zinc-cadmium efflux system outer membrane protein
VIRPAGITQLAAIGATTAVLWLSPADDVKNGFQAGSTDLFFVLDAERRLRAVQLDFLKLKVELQTKYAGIERLAGGSL